MRGFYLQAAGGDRPALLPSLVWASRVVGALVVLLILAAPAFAGAGIYGYEDAQGVLHFTNINPDRHYTLVSAPRGLVETPASGLASRSLYDPLILRASRRHGLPPALVKAVIRVESAFDARALSKKGAMGLMQLMPDTAQKLGVEDAFAADQNVFGGAAYLRNLHNRYGSWSYTLAAYNAGPRTVDRYRGIPPFHETREYVRKVLSYYRRYHGDFAR